jgi:hypothetical protein
MKNEDKNFIKREQIAAIFIPGFVQYKNNQQEKGFVIFIWVIGMSISWFYYPTYSTILPIFAAVTYAYGIFDSLLIYRDLNQKRRSISYDAEKYLEKPDKTAQKPIPLSSIDKGQKFEDFILKKFDKNLFSIVKKTHPFQGADSHYIESNLDPDFIFRYIPSREKFGVETKFRSDFGSEIVTWSRQDQLERYKQFESEEKIPIYVVIGLGGMADNPNELFLIPLRRIKSPELSLQFLSGYNVNSRSNFTWRQGSFWNSGYLHLES